MTQSDTAIELGGIGKVFRLYPDLVQSRFKQYLLPGGPYYREKIALSDVNLTVRKGEVVGVIGPNGAGKTTLLKIIAGISRSTSGRMRISGRVVAVLALGLGFHPRLTGLQNIELGGMMLGMTRAEVKERRDWIVDFSELGSYIDSPLTTYSSGMRARLSFAVAACQNPEILIIDEALATGDIRFVQKCIDRIHQITKSGTTALFVSHSIWSIKRLTQRCILIDNGKIADDGPTDRVADRYYEAMLKSEKLVASATSDHRDFVGTGEVRLARVDLRDKNDVSVRVVSSGEPASLLLELETQGDVPRATLALFFQRADGVTATAVSGLAGGTLDATNKFVEPTFALKKGRTTIKIDLNPVLIAPGDYSVDMHIFDPENHSGFTSDRQFYFKTRIIEFGVRKLGNPNRMIVYYQPASIEKSTWSDARAH